MRISWRGPALPSSISPASRLLVADARHHEPEMLVEGGRAFHVLITGVE
jgi:hypothetical protein